MFHNKFGIRKSSVNHLDVAGVIGAADTEWGTSVLRNANCEGSGQKRFRPV